MGCALINKVVLQCFHLFINKYFKKLYSTVTITAGVSIGRNLYFTSPHRGTFCNFSGNPHSWECHHFQAVHHFATAACWEKPIVLIFRSQWKPSTRAEPPRPLPPFTTCWLSLSAQIQRAQLLPDSCWIPPWWWCIGCWESRIVTWAPCWSERAE